MSEQTHRLIKLSTGREEERARRNARWLEAFIERKKTTVSYLAKLLKVAEQDVQTLVDAAKTKKWDIFIPLEWEPIFDTIGKRIWRRGKVNNESVLDVPFHIRKKEHEKNKAKRRRDLKIERDKAREEKESTSSATNSASSSEMIPAPQEERASVKIVSGINVSQDPNGVLVFSAYSNIPSQAITFPFRFEHTFNLQGLEPLKK